MPRAAKPKPKPTPKPKPESTPKPTAETVVMLEIDRIEPWPASAVRAKHDADAIESFGEALDKLPPLHVMADTGDKHRLTDGFHRLQAFIAKGRDKVPCVITTGDEEAACTAACHANEANVMVRVTNADKRHRVETMLKTFPNKSANKIAEMCGVHHSTVLALKKEDVSESETSPATIIDCKGRRQPAHKPRKKQEATPEPEPDPYDMMVNPDLDPISFPPETREQAKPYGMSDLINTMHGGDTPQHEPLPGQLDLPVADDESENDDASVESGPDEDDEIDPSIFDPTPQEAHWLKFFKQLNLFFVTLPRRGGIVGLSQGWSVEVKRSAIWYLEQLRDGAAQCLGELREAEGHAQAESARS